jgi:16S rRNA (guanine966-N2)-methyltransferase
MLAINTAQRRRCPDRAGMIPLSRSKCETLFFDDQTMRIIAGKYRGRRLKSPPSLETRPTSDRLRETLFNILAPRIKGARFLDLCAGSGAVGIEALSRGALHATFVDQSRRMCALIEVNLNELDVNENDVEVVNDETTEFLGRWPKKERSPFDIVFFDPPYEAEYDVILKRLSEDNGFLLSAGAILVVEHHKKRELKEEFGSLHRYRTLKQGDSVLSFYEHSRVAAKYL